MPGIVEALAALPCRSAVIDGEAVILGEDGVSDILALHAALASRRAPEAQFVAFDLLHLDGADFRDRPIEERRARLAELVDGTGRSRGTRRNSSSLIQFSTAISGDGPDVYRVAREHGLEGIVSKRRGSPYRSEPDEELGQGDLHEAR
jgi:bifunctional non-homologous end joining protein LigD